jgi:hypothetical protein
LQLEGIASPVFNIGPRRWRRKRIATDPQPFVGGAAGENCAGEVKEDRDPAEIVAKSAQRETGVGGAADDGVNVVADNIVAPTAALRLVDAERDRPGVFIDEIARE